MIVVKHDDKAFIDGKRVIFGTTRAFYEQIAAEVRQPNSRTGLPPRITKTVDEQVERSISLGHEQFWVILESSVICADPGFYAERDRIDATRVRFSSGDEVEIDGQAFRIVRTYNGNFKLVEVENPPADVESTRTSSSRQRDAAAPNTSSIDLEIDSMGSAPGALNSKEAPLNLEYHQCGDDFERIYDAQGIYLCRVCPRCRTAKLATYRPEILSGYTQADVDEPIEEE